MYKKAIDRKTHSSLEILISRGLIDEFYLAGGTALALHLGHRISYDLDFFSEKEFNCKKLLENLRKVGSFNVDVFKNDTLTGVFNGIKISFFYYPYKVLFPFELYEGMRIASICDIGCMKIVAIVNRGTKRDFIDLYFICRDFFSLKEILEFYTKKYGEFATNIVSIKKSLVYFDDAEMDDMPEMIKKISWDKVKKYFVKEVMSL
ncbi:MAG TPA: nucleotidyl transferase AbiEii/AbiGii toxin family protein [Elusimicrobiales bacterium]|nr:nucleotidyl transferase AbiEii/AbiGii toxin family protein [Elusimicrobiales bacterium]HPO95555.1 nucleotidyl transferase AbiEii/AbiGii toxin family protein [Elusimicrobiales bacterium]